MKLNNWFDAWLTIFSGCLVMVLVIIFTGWIIMLLWNWLMPIIFPSVSKISIWQAYGLTLLSKLLFSTNIHINKKN